ncbi:MAG: hypothetical protein DI535_00780 [Citrobacter freundii]|nr:MAG: hypothetical protein DI535_00780 [Citrobacter freundii]
MVKGQELTILFIGDLAFLTKEVAMDFTQVKISDHPVRFKSEAHWAVRVIAHIETEKRLHVEVLKYYVGKTNFSYEQLQLEDQLSDVESVTFKSIDTTGLLQTLHGALPRTFSPPKPEMVFRDETPVQRKPVVHNYQEPFSIAIKDVKFHDGYVSFERKLPGFKKPVAFQIPNVHLVEQYDAIKNYFGIVLKTRKIEVVPNITLTDGDITSVNATSAEIDRIDPTLIEEVKFELVKSTRRKELPDDQHLFAIDEYIETFTDEENTAGIFNNDSDFMEVILERSGTKHYHHLRFLSSRQEAVLQKLRVIQRPFSFVFFVAGAQQYHIVWETLDTTEATYVWSVAKDDHSVNEFVGETHTIIERILRDGKSEYIRQLNRNLTRVFHEYMDLQSGFRKWKKEIETVIYL